MLSIDEAIKHCEEVAERYETQAKMIDRRKLGSALNNPTACRECATEHRQLAVWLRELKEAKRLLKLAILDFSTMYDHIYDCDGMCESCPIHGNRDTCDKWRYADEVKKLLEVE